MKIECVVCLHFAVVRSSQEKQHFIWLMNDFNNIPYENICRNISSGNETKSEMPGDTVSLDVTSLLYNFNHHRTFKEIWKFLSRENIEKIYTNKFNCLIWKFFIKVILLAYFFGRYYLLNNSTSKLVLFTVMFLTAKIFSAVRLLSLVLLNRSAFL